MMSSTRITPLVVVVVAALLIPACGTPTDDSVLARSGALDIGVGYVQGLVSWSGSPVSSPDVYVRFLDDATTGTAIDGAGHYRTPDVAEATRDLSVYKNGCAAGPLVTTSVTVSAGVGAEMDFDLTPILGRVVASVTLNGLPTGSDIDIGGGCRLFPDASGRISYFLRPGTFTASSPFLLGPPLPLTVVAGQTVDLGQIALVQGRISGDVTWNGGPVTFPVSVRKPPQLAELHDGQGRYTTPLIPPGSYPIAVYSARRDYAPSQCLLAQATVPVTGSVSTTSFDLTATTGRVHGSLTFNGVPASAWIDVGACGGDYAQASSGTFALYLPPGTYAAAVKLGPGPSLPVLGSIPFPLTVVAGQDLDVGTVEIPLGSIEGNVTWNGAPFPAAELINRSITTGAWSAPISTFGTYEIQRVTPGPHTVTFSSFHCPQTQVDVATMVPAGGPAVVDFDLTPVMGRASGRLTLNGAPVEMSFDMTCGGGVSDANGFFTTKLVPAGAQIATATLPDGSRRSFPLLVTAGQTTDAGTIDLLAPSGALQGVVSWNGQPASGTDGTGLATCLPGRCTFVGATGAYAFDRLAPGTFGAHVQNRCGGTMTGTTSVTITDGAIATTNFDITSGAGRVEGAITINGAPPGQLQILIDGGPPRTGPNLMEGNCLFGTDPEGRFETFLPVGAYTGRVLDRFHRELGTFPFSVVAGQVTDIDGAATDAGLFVAVHLLGGSGQVGGITLTFSSVVQPGSTTVVASGVGPPPPSGYQIVGFPGNQRYWNIDTSATYAGAITICLHYDPADVMGNEALLRLVHDAGSGFQNITMSLDTAANVVCGTTTSLSPFAIVEPAPDTTGPVFMGVPEVVTAFATSSAGAKATYTAPTAIDAVDGARPVTCTPASGKTFPLGKTPVTCTSTDRTGHTSAATFPVWVQVQTPADGTFFGKPIRSNGTSVFRVGRAVPVRFQLTGASKGITNLTAKLVVTKISDQVHGTAEDVGDEDGEDTDSVFKWKPGPKLYLYRWKTRGETQGTYRLTADLGDGVTHQINVSLKGAR